MKLPKRIRQYIAYRKIINPNGRYKNASWAGLKRVCQNGYITEKQYDKIIRKRLDRIYKGVINSERN